MRPCLHNGYHQPGQCPEANNTRFIDFADVTAVLAAAHYPADDPIRRAISAFDMPNILDEHEAGYDRYA